MKYNTVFVLVCLFTVAANADIVTVAHHINNLPASGYLSVDLDDDGTADINLASNFYVSSWAGTQFVGSYAMLGDVIDAGLSWGNGNTWPDASGSVQEGHLYLPIRNTTIGNYFGYVSYDYHPDSNSVSLNSYTYDNTGAAITVVPEPVSASMIFLVLPLMIIRRLFRG